MILAERGGDIYTKAVGRAFFIGQGSWRGPKGEDRNKSGFQSEVDE